MISRKRGAVQPATSSTRVLSTLLACACVFLGYFIITGAAENLVSVLRACAIAYAVGFVLLAFLVPKWGLPVLLMSVAPYKIFTDRYSVYLDNHTIVPLSLAIWILFVGYIARKMFAMRAVPLGRSEVVLRMFYMLIILTSIPAVVGNLESNDLYSITLTIVRTGIVEPYLLFLIAREWLANYGEKEAMVRILFISVVVSAIAGYGFSNILHYDMAYATESNLRANIAGFASANLAGHVLCLLYPLSLIFYRRNVLVFVFVAIVMWVICILLISRAPLFVMAMESIGMVVFTKRLRGRTGLGIIFGSLGLAFALAVPIIAREELSRRMSEGIEFARYQLNGSGVLSTNDSGRVESRQTVMGYIWAHPLGGMAATGNVDPENLFVDTAAQLGVIPALLFGMMLAYAMHLAVRVGSQEQGFGQVSAYAISMAGYIVYGIIAGSQISKISVSIKPYWANATPSIFLVIVLALLSFRPTVKKTGKIASDLDRSTDWAS